MGHIPLAPSTRLDCHTDAAVHAFRYATRTGVSVKLAPVTTQGVPSDVSRALR